MTQDDFTKFRDVMRMLGSVFGKEPDGVMLDAYWLALRAWDMRSFENAAGLLMATSKFMPRPSDFNEVRKIAEPRAGEAWAVALSNCTCWRGDKPSPGGRIDRAVRAIGGYRTIAMADIETALPHIERRFKEAYDELTDVEDARVALGFSESHELLENSDAPKNLGFQKILEP